MTAETLVDFDRDGDLDRCKGLGPANPSAATPTVFWGSWQQKCGTMRTQLGIDVEKCILQVLQFRGTSSGTGSGSPMGSTGFCGSKFRVQKVACPRFRRFRCSMGPRQVRFCSRGCREPVLGTGFWELQGSKKVPGSGGFHSQGVRKLLLYLESILLYYENIHLICKLNV